MPKLTITAETRGVALAFRGLNSLIDKGTDATIKQGAAAKTIAGHWNAASVSLRDYQSRQREALKLTQDIAKATRNVRPPGVDPLFGTGAAAAGRAATKAAQDMARAQRQAASAAQRQARSLARASRSSAAIRRNLVAASRIRPGGSGGVSGVGLIGKTSNIIDVRGTSRELASGVTGGINTAVSGLFKNGGGAFSSIVKGVGLAAGLGLSALGPGGAIAGLFVGGISAAAGTMISSLTGILGSAWKASMSILSPLLKTAVGTAVGAALAASAFSIQQAIAAEPIRQSFDNIARTRGLGDPNEVRGRLQTASLGTLANRDLEQATNQALFLGAANNVEQMELLIEAGRRLGRAFGRDAKQGVDDLSLGIGRQSKVILDNLGILIDVNSATRDYAKAVGLTTAALTDEDRRIAFNIAAYSSLEVKLKSLGKEQLTTGDRVARSVAQFRNLSVAVGSFATPAIGELADNWSRFFLSLRADDVVAGVRSITSEMKSLAGSVGKSIFGEGDFGGALKGFGGSLADAIEKPSINAFKIVGIEARKIFDIAALNITKSFQSAIFRIAPFFVDVVKTFRKALIIGVGQAFDAIAKLTPAGFLADKLGLGGNNEKTARAIEAATRGGFDSIIGIIDSKERAVLKIIEESRKTQSKLIVDEANREIAKIRGEINSARKVLLPGERPEVEGPLNQFSQGAFKLVNKTFGGAAGGAIGDSGLFANLADKLAAAVRPLEERRESRKKEVAEEKRISAERAEIAKAELAERKGALELGREIFGKQLKARSEEVRELTREIADRKAAAASLRESFFDLTRAIDGRGPLLTIQEQSTRLAATLRGFPERIEKDSLAVSDATKDLAERVREGARAETEARRELIDSIKRAARDFLGLSPVEGQNAASRAAQRRFQRDEARARKRAINESFQAPSFQDAFGGGGFGGFGAQNVDRRSSSFFNLDPRASVAAKALDGLTDDGAIRQAEAAIIETQIEAARQIAEANEIRRQSLEAQELTLEEQKKANAEAIELNKTTAANQAKLLKEVEAMTANLAEANAREAATKARLDRLETAIRRIK